MKYIASLVFCLLFSGYAGVYAASGPEQWMTRFELAEAVESLQCRDCLVPDKQTREYYNQQRFSEQKNDPQFALDDISYGDVKQGNQNYYRCIASVVDKKVMKGYPKQGSPYCPGKFCGYSFVTFAEMLQVMIRLVEPQLWKTYSIDRRAVGLWAKDAPDVSIAQRRAIAAQLKACPDAACPATTSDAFESRLRRCSQDLDRCDFSAFGDFKKNNLLTAQLNVLIQAKLITKEQSSRKRFQVLFRDDIKGLLDTVKSQYVQCDGSNTDYDSDGITNRQDLCPYSYDPRQHDTDSDGVADVCDDDIDGDGVKNVLGVVDPRGQLIVEKVKKSEDNCIIMINTDQKNSNRDSIGDACDPILGSSPSPARALRIAASPLRGNAPLNVVFTSDRVGDPESLRWDFGDGNLLHSMNAAHTFLKAGQYMVRAETLDKNKAIVSFLPVVVLPNLSLKAGLELVTKQLATTASSGTLALQHIFVGSIAKLIVSAKEQRITIEPKQSVTIPVGAPGLYPIEIQAYNSAGERVALSQISIDTLLGRGSQLHASSLDPLVGDTVALTTLFAGFEEQDVLSVERDFGDGTTRTTQNMLTDYSWKKAGVYAVHQSIQFRDPTKTAHSNAITIMVSDTSGGKTLSLTSDRLAVGVGELVTAEILLENISVADLKTCLWQRGTESTATVTDEKRMRIQRNSFALPGSHTIQVACETTDAQWYTAGITVAVDDTSVCLTNSGSLRCDMDKDTIPDLCDEDIDGDGATNWMGMITKENPDCSLTTGNTNQQLLQQCQQACQAGAGSGGLDNCPFVKNPNQQDSDKNGLGAACDNEGAGSTPGGSTAGSTPGSSTPGGTTPGGTTPGGTTPGSTPGGSTAGSTTAGDSDGDGVPDTSDGCAATPGGGGSGCPSEPQDDTNDPDQPENPFVAVEECTQCPCPEADYASALRKGDRVRALLLDEGGTIIYRYTKPETIDKDVMKK